VVIHHIKDVNRAVENVMREELYFKIINVRHHDARVDGVEIDAKKLLIYLINQYGLAGKAWTVGVEVHIVVDSAKLDEDCCQIMADWKFSDVMTRDPMIVDKKDPNNQMKLLLEMMQSDKYSMHVISLIFKDNKAAHDSFLLLSVKLWTR
jgi:hypothetical protein